MDHRAKRTRLDPVPPHRSAWRDRRIDVAAFAAERRQEMKRSFTTRHVSDDAMRTIIRGAIRPRLGDLVLARVLRLGSHSRLELPSGRKARMFPGDEILVPYGHRYATDQFEATVPPDLGATQLVASGGLAGTVRAKSRDIRAATDISPIGLVGDARGRPLNLAEYGIRPLPVDLSRRPPTVAVLGSSMSAGKTTTINRLVRGLHAAGQPPGVTKVTGTGSGGDYWVMLDAGAKTMADFTDVGLPSTYRVDLPVVEQTMIRLVDHLISSASSSIILEVADGLFQRETAHLISSPVFHERVDGVIFAAADSLGAAMGAARLREVGLDVLAIAGRITRNPLAVSEARDQTGLPVLTLGDLADPAVALSLLGSPTNASDHRSNGQGEMTVDLTSEALLDRRSTPEHP